MHKLVRKIVGSPVWIVRSKGFRPLGFWPVFEILHGWSGCSRCSHKDGGGVRPPRSGAAKRATAPPTRHDVVEGVTTEGGPSRFEARRLRPDPVIMQEITDIAQGIYMGGLSWGEGKKSIKSVGRKNHGRSGIRTQLGMFGFGLEYEVREHEGP